MPAACSFGRRLSTRKASITMSCVAEAVATSSAPNATSHGAFAGSVKREKHDRGHQQELREHQPAAAAADSARQHRHVERIDQRRPEELDGVGHADQREQADGAEVDAGLGHPDRQRRAGQRERQARREAEKHHDQHARPQIDRERLGPSFRLKAFRHVIARLRSSPRKRGPKARRPNRRNFWIPAYAGMSGRQNVA